jgi:hypothetical protein
MSHLYDQPLKLQDFLQETRVLLNVKNTVKQKLVRASNSRNDKALSFNNIFNFKGLGASQALFVRKLFIKIWQ